MAAALRALRPTRRSHSVYTHVLHAHTQPADLRELLNREWATVSVVSGLVFLLAGESAVAGPFRGEDSTSARNSGAGLAFLAANMLAYSASATSCLVALLLLHASNAVPQGQLHAFLRSVHIYLWLPFVGLFISMVATAVSNASAALIIYDSWAAFGARLGVSLLWLGGLACVLVKLSRSAVQNSTLQSEAQAAAAADREAGGGGGASGTAATA